MLAKAVGQLASMLNAPPPSRARSLPHGIGAVLRCCAGHKNLWERACSRKRWVSLHQCRMCHRLRGQARSHMGSAVCRGVVPSSKTVGASLLAKAVDQLASMPNVPPPSRASPLPHGIGAVSRCCAELKNCGSELARESGGSACINAECATAFAGKPAPTLLGLHQVKKTGLARGQPGRRKLQRCFNRSITTASNRIEPRMTYW